MKLFKWLFVYLMLEASLLATFGQNDKIEDGEPQELHSSLRKFFEFVDSSRLDEAEKIFSGFSEHEKEAAETIFSMVLDNKKEPADKLETLDTILVFIRTNPKFYLQRAHINTERNNLLVAEFDIRDTLKIIENDDKYKTYLPIAYTARGVLRYKKENYISAKNDFQKALLLHPNASADVKKFLHDMIESCDNLAKKRGMADDSDAAFDRLEERMKSDVAKKTLREMARREIGESTRKEFPEIFNLMLRNDDNALISKFNSMTEKDKTFLMLAFMRDLAQILPFYAYGDDLDKEKVDVFIDRMLTIFPTSDFLLISRARTNIINKKYISAIRYLYKALETNKDNGEIYYFLGLAKSLLNDYEGALKDLRIAGDLKYAEAFELIGKINEILNLKHQAQTSQ